MAGPVFILGVPRSGTSLVYKALALHPDAVYVSNWAARSRLPELAVFNRVGARFAPTRRRVWFGDDGNAYAYLKDRSTWERLFPQPVEGEPLLRRCGFTQVTTSPPPPPSADVAERLRATDARLRRASGGRIWLCKRVANNHRVADLFAAFPDARFIEVRRDGRAVASSLQRVDWWPDEHIWWYGGSPVDWERAGGDPWELAARHWVEEIAVLDRAVSRLPPERYRSISYDELLADPHERLHDLADFAGCRASTTWDRGIAELSFPVSDTGWRRYLAGTDLIRVEAILGDVLAANGFES